MAAAKRKKVETAEQTRDRWYAGQARIGSDVRDAIVGRWEAGQVSHITTEDGTHYERFDLTELDAGLSGYVVIEWDDHGYVSVGQA